MHRVPLKIGGVSECVRVDDVSKFLREIRLSSEKMSWLGKSLPLGRASSGEVGVFRVIFGGSRSLFTFLRFFLRSSECILNFTSFTVPHS